MNNEFEKLKDEFKQKSSTDILGRIAVVEKMRVNLVRRNKSNLLQGMPDYYDREADLYELEFDELCEADRILK